MKRRTIGLIGIALLLVALTVGTAGAALAGGPFGSGGTGWGPGAMMGGYGPSGSGPGSMMGSGYGPGGMMAGRGNAQTNGQPITLDQAQKDAQAYIDRTGNADLALDEVMEFQNNFYAIVKEKSTGIGAFEVLINKGTGAVIPEPGPNMMWNTRYGMMGRNSPMGQMMGYTVQTGPTTISVDQARQTAQRWLDQNQPGATTEPPDQFYGYDTVHILKDGKVTGMLSVNGYTGQVWYHTWHGPFIQTKDLGA